MKRIKSCNSERITDETSNDNMFDDAGGAGLVFPACVVNGAAVSKTFQILYRNEEVHLDDHVLFKLHLIVDAHKVQ